MPKKQPQQGISWSEVIAIFSSITGFVTSVIAWLDIAQYGQMGYQNFLWAGIVVAVVVWGIILWLLYKQKNIAFSIGLAITMVAATIVGIWWTSTKRAEEERIKVRDEKFIVLIAAFDGPEEVYGLRNEIIEKLGTDFPKGGEVEIETTDEIIKPEKGSERARELGENVQADLVIWGWYRPTDNPNVTIHIENLESEKIIPLRKSEMLEPIATMAELESFSFQQQAGQETSALISFLAGIVNYEKGNYEFAIARFNQALANLSPDLRLIQIQEEIYLYRGNAYANQEDYDRAIQNYDQALQFNPNYILAYDGRGNAYANQEDYDRAIQDYDQALQLDPTFISAFNGRGRTYANQKDYERAIQDYDKALQLDPNYVFAYINRGNAYANQKDYERAIQDYDQALQLDPSKDSAYNNRGTVYERLGNYERAIKDYDQAIKLDPNNTDARFNRGSAYFRLEDYGRAIQDFDQVLQLNPNDAEAYQSRGTAYLHIEDYERAIQDFDQAIKINPNDLISYNNRGGAYKYLGNYERAIKDFEQVLQLDPTFTSAYNNRGIIYADLGNYESAIQDYNKAIEIDSNDAMAYNNRGVAYKYLGNCERAIQDYDRAIEIDPNYAIAYNNRGLAHQACGNTFLAGKDLIIANKNTLVWVFVILVVYLISDSWLIPLFKKRKNASLPN